MAQPNTQVSTDDVRVTVQEVVNGQEAVADSILRIAQYFDVLAQDGMKGQAGASLATKAAELRQRSNLISQRAVDLANNLQQFSNSMDESTQAAAAQFANL